MTPRRTAFLAAVLAIAAFVIFAVPVSLEGPVLVPLGPGHGLSALDGVALVPLLAASALTGLVLWRGRSELRVHAGRRPVLVFAAGTGLGLLLASAFSGFFWWWAIGATILVVTTGLAAAHVITARPEHP